MAFITFNHNYVLRSLVNFLKKEGKVVALFFSAGPLVRLLSHYVNNLPREWSKIAKADKIDLLSWPSPRSPSIALQTVVLSPHEGALRLVPATQVLGSAMLH